MMLGELESWGHDIIAVNDTLQEKAGSYAVSDIETNERLAEGTFSLPPNGVKRSEG